MYLGYNEEIEKRGNCSTRKALEYLKKRKL